MSILFDSLANDDDDILVRMSQKRFLDDVIKICEKHNYKNFDFEKLSEDTYVVRTIIFDRRLFNELSTYLKTSELDLIWELKT